MYTSLLSTLVHPCMLRNSWEMDPKESYLAALVSNFADRRVGLGLCLHVESVQCVASHSVAVILLRCTDQFQQHNSNFMVWVSDHGLSFAWGHLLPHGSNGSFR